ncbi:MAG: DUF6270 domain-containing protein [Actinomycetota bacterium]
MRLAIWGSCATRDVLEAGVHPFELDYHARTSWVSQAAKPQTAPVQTPGGAGFGERMVREDLTKQVVADLIASQPEILVVDLIDERFDVVKVQDSWYTMSDYYERLGLVAGLRAAASATTSYRSPERGRQFAGAASLLAPELAFALPRTRIVLHQAWYTARSADAAFPFYATATKNALSSNEALTGWYASLRSAFGTRLHVVEPPRDLLIGDPRHRWGLAHYHYVPGYYTWMLAALTDLAAGPLKPRWMSRRPPCWAPDWAQVAA